VTRLSRQCYAKFWRGRGWGGGGFRYARRQRCDGGSLLVPGIRAANGEPTPDDRRWRWKFHRYNQGCGVLALPYVTRWADPSWLRWRLRCWWLDRGDRREARRIRRAWRKSSRLTRRVSD
jgi:hypothetical protein